MAMLDKEELNAVYEDMLVRVELGLTSNGSNHIDGNAFVHNLIEAIQEKAQDRYEGLDAFSIVFGAVSERILRQYYNEQGKEWW
jgi:hypothetical protein